jgi:hypothetical protein
MREIPSYLEGHQSVVEAYGYWPGFHDAQVLRFARDTETIELEVATWEMTSEVDSRGYFVLTKRNEIGFRFSGIVATELDDFIPENILFNLGFSSVADCQRNGQFLVVLDSAMGSELCGRFTATAGRITFVRPSREGTATT